MKRDEWMQTHTGGRFDLLEPWTSDIRIYDVARSLSRIARFCGHTQEVYTVARHSVAVALECYVQAKRMGALHSACWNAATVGLLHDASEAYTGDITSPVKRAFLDSDAKEKLAVIEHTVERALLRSECFNIDQAECDLLHRLFVKRADLSMLKWESENLLPGGRRGEWPMLEGVAMPAINPHALFANMPEDFDAFLDMFTHLHQVRPFPWWTNCADELRGDRI